MNTIQIIITICIKAGKFSFVRSVYRFREIAVFSLSNLFTFHVAKDVQDPFWENQSSYEIDIFQYKSGHEEK